MPRQPRIQFPGACYHVMARGDRREPIVLDDRDRERFLQTFAQACGRTGWRVFAWVLMDNHYHFVIQTPEANLVEGMKWFQNTWTRRLNTRHGQWGHVFGGRYKAILVEAPDTQDASRWRKADYLSTLIDYVHLNPVRAGLVEPAGQLDYRWSSLSSGYAVAPSKRAKWLDVKRGLETLDFPDSVGGRRAYLRHLQQRALAEEGSGEVGLTLPKGQGLQSTLRRGWYWGSEAFRERLMEMLPNLNALSRGYRSSPAGRSQRRQNAEELLGSELRSFRITESEVLQLPRGDWRRVALAWLLWRRTCVPQKWIAERLGMKSAANVSQQVRRFEKLADRALPKDTRKWRKQKLKFVT